MTTLKSSLLILIVSFAWRRRGDLPDFLTAALAFTIASPIAWEHHYGILPPILMVLVPAIALSKLSHSLWAALLLGGIYVAAACFLIMPADQHSAQGIPSLAFSALLYAGLATMLLLCVFGREIALLERRVSKAGPSRPGNRSS